MVHIKKKKKKRRRKSFKKKTKPRREQIEVDRGQLTQDERKWPPTG